MLLHRNYTGWSLILTLSHIKTLIVFCFVYSCLFVYTEYCGWGKMK